MDTRAIIILAAVTSLVSATYHPEDSKDSPDIRLLKTIGRKLWDEKDLRENLLQQLETELDLDLDFTSGEGNDSEQFACGACLAFVSTLKSLINRGLEFEDVRNASVQVCYNVTELMDYDGQIMCPGIIDNFGPHVYYVLNVSTMDARETCEFFKSCESGKYSHKMVDNYFSVTRNKNEEPKTERRKDFTRADMIKVVHLTDAHIDVDYDQGAPSTSCNLPLCCRDYWDGTGVAGEWGEYSCNMPVKTLQVILEHMVTQQPDVIMYTGDTPCHAIWEETVDGQLTQQQVLTDQLRTYFSNISSHVAIGNHDVYPVNLHYSEREDIQEMQTRLIEMWGDLAGFEDEQRETFQKSAYYTKLLVPGLRVLSYNTNYATNENFYGPLLPDSPFWLDMVQFMDDTFNRARNNGEKVIVLGHHLLTPGKFEFYVQTINDIFDRNGDLIVFQLYGHSHKDSFQMSVDGNFTTTSVWISSGTGGTRNYKNPSYKIFYLDPETFEPLDADNFFLNISAAVDGKTPELELMYTYLDEYGMVDLTAASFQDLVDRMVYDVDLFGRYRYNEGTRVTEPEPCDDECRYNAICGMRATDDARETTCRDMMPFP